MAKVRKPNLIDPAALVQRRVHHPIPAAGRYFAAPRLPDSFQTLIDPAKHPAQPWRDLPPPTGASPFRLSLETVLSPQAIDTISKSGRMVFHAVGDTGGVNTPTQIQNVASFMERDFAQADPTLHPSFFYHLGDVVYYAGETANYFPEFYEPYNTYPGPIFAIPGNHDGDVDPLANEPSLHGFMDNFCSPAPVHRPEASDAPRSAMTQPNVYWTLDTPLATLIGLYSNCPEGGQIRPDQVAWFESELAGAPKDRALVVAVHHPLYSAYGPHPGSQHLFSLMEAACVKTKRIPDVVLTGHVHNYQRFTGTLAGKQIPFIVAGAGGYNARLHSLANIFHNTKLPIKMANSTAVLQSFNDSHHGYLRIIVKRKTLRCDYFAVPDPGAPASKRLKPFDSVTVKTA